MREKVKSLINSQSIRNSFLLMVGTGISQFAPVLFSPLLTRIYSPADFGNLAIFMAFSVIIGMCASGMYEYAIVLPENEKDALNIIKLITILALSISFLIGITIVLLSLFLKLDFFYFLVPFSVFFIACYNVMSYWFNRVRKYKTLNMIKIFQAVILIAASFVFYNNKNGLIYGFLIGGLFCFFVYFFVFYKHFRTINLQEIKILSVTYKKFPILILPSSLMNTVSSYAPVFFMKKFYSTSQLGSFSMSSRVLTAPLSVISTAIGQVYFKNLSDYSNEKNDNLIKKTFLNSTYVLCVLSASIFLPLFFFGEELSIIVFGKAWRQAGQFIEIIALASMVKFIVSPLSTILIVKKELNKLAKWQTVYFCTTMTIFIVGSFYSIKTLLWIYVIHETVLYGIYYYVMRKVVYQK
ncbi:oligosaccharide flippase family protein [Chryseobacterium camelliae]|uniref:Oligosaccharide flippase family protein n=1 Tax=Chryseobacterium camelliae TaxID=1265445 RepID=A0ABY7QQH3_9FLAO|nr:oligosaccharide flippase family protein [Chryseobacterium camelliae]WBV61569.1 oligosaccharide flippase family protein [Chryseobacterium camelliae]